MSTPIGTPTTWEVQGQTVSLPVVVRDASSGTARFLVDLTAARDMVRLEGVEPEEFLPGKAMLSLAMVDYRDNDLGTYNEFSIAFFVRESRAARGVPFVSPWARMMRGQVATFICHLPVDQAFTCEAGRRIWGFPKTVDDVSINYADGRARCRLVMDGQLVLELDTPRGGSRALPESELWTYTALAGRAHKTSFRSASRGFGVSRGSQTSVRLGTHPIAAQLRALGLPKAPLIGMWMENFSATFGGPTPL